MIPNFVRNSIAVSGRVHGPHIAKIVTNSHNHFLQAELRDAYREEAQIRSELTSTFNSKTFLSNSSPHYESIGTALKFVYQKAHQESSKKLSSKFQKLYHEKYGKFPTQGHPIWPDKHFRDSIVVNTTSSQFSEAELDVLALGPKFALPPKNPPLLNTLTSVESTLSKPHSTQAAVPVEALRASVSNAISRNKVQSVSQDVHKHINNVVRDLKAKSCDENLVYVSADKGAKTVIMEKAEYQTKLSTHFSNQTLFSKTTKSKIHSAYSATKSLLSSFLTSATVFSLLPSLDRSKIPKPYALVKTHKPNFPIRTITPTIGSMFYKLSKLLDMLLKPAVNKLKYRMPSVAEFVSDLRNMEIRPNHFFVSFDAVSLFDNVDTNVFLQSLPNILKETETEWRNSVKTFATAPITTIVKLFNTLLNNSYFSYNNQLLTQTFGTPMGSPVSVSVSDIYLGVLEQEFLENVCPIHLRPVYFKRYIDDCIALFVLIPPYSSIKSMMNAFLHEFHTFLSNTRIRFTVEYENSLNSINFLDCAIKRCPNKVDISVYRKPTHSNRYTSKYSYIPKQFLFSTLNTLKLRALRYCTSPTLLAAEFKLLYDTFVHKHGYNPNIIGKFFVLDNLTQTCAVQPTPTTNLPRLILPFSGKMSLCISNIFKNAGFPVSFTSNTTLRSKIFYKGVDENEKLSTNNVVYKLQCQQCPKFYIGMTTRKFSVRLQEHKKAVGSGLSDDKISAMSMHARECGHTFDFDKFLCSDVQYHSLCFKEALYILSNENNPDLCNIKATETSSRVSPIYSSLFPQFKL